MIRVVIQHAVDMNSGSIRVRSERVRSPLRAVQVNPRIIDFVEALTSSESEA